MSHHERIVLLRAPVLAGALVALGVAPTFVAAKDAVPNLGGGLEQLALPSTRATAPPGPISPRQAAGAADQLSYPIKFDDAGRALVRITLDGAVPGTDMLKIIEGIGGVRVVASDMNYRAGVIEAYVPASSLIGIASTKGVLAVVPSSPVVTNVGKADSQGIVQHRVDKITGVDGTGITVGVISDSYGSIAGGAAADIASGDLPGAGNPLGNTEPVVIVEDTSGSDEGRAMLQIVHDLAPKARLGFATGDGGEVNFANNIRALAGFADAPNTVPGFKADVIVDDLIYLAEPFFQDGIVAQAVDQVAAAGVSYFSSAGNTPSTNAYDSPAHIVPAEPASWAGTNLNFDDVDPALYAGGFHNFAHDRSGKIEIAQTVKFGFFSLLVLQWNEPFDQLPPTAVGAALAEGVGTTPAGGTFKFSFDATAGEYVRIFLDADASTTGIANPDLTLTLLDPSGAQIQYQDAARNPESLVMAMPATGTYTVVVGSQLSSQFGDFQYRAQHVEEPATVQSDFNLLLFADDGTYLGAYAENNLATNRPLELGLFLTSTLQIVIARANVPDAHSRNVADRIRYVTFGGISPQTHFSYNGPVTYGHSVARGAMGVAAYPFYAPFVPEAFTSPGPSTIYFDTDNKRLRFPDVRQKPDVAAMDGGNTTFFGSDSNVDEDTLPNFFGTSAAAPHAAAIAALVLEAAGGPGSVKPVRMRKILQASAFPHDLDPYFSSGFALTSGGLLAVNASADPSATSQFDPNVFTLTQVGRKFLRNFSVNGSGANPTQTPFGVVFDERGTPESNPQGQPFVVGHTHGIDPLDVTASFSLPADAPGLPGQWKQLDLSFLPGTFGRGDLLSFGVDRDEADVAGPAGAASGNSADLLGGGVLIPSGQRVPGGAKFFGTYEDGTPFEGEFFNLIGRGYSTLDGYGFINAEAAVKAVTRGRK